MDSLQNYITDSEEYGSRTEEDTEDYYDAGVKECSTTETSVDYFSLNDTDSEKKTADEPEVKKQKISSFETEAGERVSVPQSGFWNSFTVDEAKECVKKTVVAQPKESGFSVVSKERKPGMMWKRDGVSNSQSELGNKTQKVPPSTSLSSTTNAEARERQLYYVHSKITPFLSKKNIACKSASSVERSIPNAHAGVVNRVSWSVAQYSHLFMSASMDGTVRVWNIWSQLHPCLTTLSVHDKAVKDAVWSLCGRQVLSCSYDRTAAIADVETGRILSRYKHDSYVTSCKFHPSNPHLSITGCQNLIRAWDSRTPERLCQNFRYKDKIGQVQDLLFNRDGDTFFSTSDELSRDTADRNIMAWDYKSGVVLSNQIYQERYSCTRLKLHPVEGHFLAQSHGNYIAMFSTNRPYKMNKAKRFEGHKLAGYSIGFDLTPDGSTVLSGDAGGRVYTYHCATGRRMKTLKTGMDVCMDVACHPVLPSTFVCCGWNGSIEVWH